MASTVSSRIVTVPNVLSLFRLILIPVFLWLLILGEYGWALVVLVVSGLTDFVDGYVARQFNQISRLGQVLDPAADRLFIFSTLIGLAWQQIIPWWLVAVIIGRDFVLLILGVVLANYRYGPLPVHHLGKMGTFALLAAMPLLVLGAAVPDVAPVSDPIAWAGAFWGAFLYWWAGIVYVRQAAGLISRPVDATAEHSDTLDDRGRS